MSFVGLHIHSDYSLLDGASQLPQLIDRAVELGMPAIALTDHGVMYGAIQLIKLCRNKNIKPIIGNEMYVINGDFKKQQRGKKFHQIVLAKNTQGYKNLVKLTTLSHLHGFQGKGIFARPCINRELLEKYHEGLIVTSGCLAGEVPQNIMQGKLEEAKKIAKWYKDLFGEDYYLEIQDHGLQEDRVVNTGIVKIAEKLKIKIVATNDSHFISCLDVEAHDALLCINTQKLIAEQKRMRYSGTEYLKSAEEMKQLFRDHLENQVIEEAIANTLEVANKVKAYEGILGDPRIPDYPIPPDHNADTYLEKLAWEGLFKRQRCKHKSEVSATYKERMEIELKVLQDKGFSTYFLVVWDYIKYARDNNIPVGPGRGSAAGSLVAYSLRITNIDPVHHGLLFERFLNPERKSMPDIDTDFCIENRDVMIKYVTKRYGEERVAQIITFNRMTSKAVLKDVGRVLGVSFGEANKMAKLIPVARGKPAKLKVMISNETPSPEFKEAYDNQEILIENNQGEKASTISVRQWIDMAIRIEGTNKTFGVHAAGVVISKEPLDEIVPLQRNNDGSVITQYHMEDIESLGLLKMDFLGLKNLTIIQNTVNLIKKNRQINLIPDDLPSEERRIMTILAKGEIKSKQKEVDQTYKLIKSGDLEGVFQLESSGMVDVVKKLKPTSIEDISSILALYRPGPLDAGLIPKFIDRKHGREEIKYQHPKLETILKETYGVLCLPKGTLIDKQDGSRKVIENVKSGEVILTSDGKKVWKAKVAKQWRSGVKEILKITLSSGTIIYSGKNHRFLTPEGDKFAWELQPRSERANGLMSGSEVYEKWQVSRNKKQLRKNEAYLLGLLIGNSYFVSSPLNISCSTEKDNVWLENLIDEIWGEEVKYCFDVLGRQVYLNLNAQSKFTALTEFLDDIYGSRSWQVKSAAKHLPQDILDYSEKDRIDLLLGLWNNCGYAQEKFLYYRSFSPRLLSQIGKLLGSLKIDYYLADNYVGVANKSRFFYLLRNSQMPNQQKEEIRESYLPISSLTLAAGLKNLIFQTDSSSRKIMESFLGKASLFKQTNFSYIPKWENREKVRENHLQISPFTLKTNLENSIFQTDISSRKTLESFLGKASLFKQTNFSYIPKWENREKVRENHLQISPFTLKTNLENSIFQTDISSRKTLESFLGKASLFKQKIYEKTYLQDARLVYVTSVEEAGEAECFDLEMEDQSSPYFLAEGVVVHNCYQEQIMKMAQDLAGYSLGEADLLRRCLSGSTKVIDAATGNLVSLKEIASKPEYWLSRKVFSLDIKSQQIVQQPITEIYFNGVRDVWEITTRTNRKIRATHDHLFYTVLGWKPLKDFSLGDRLGLPSKIPINHSSQISDAQITECEDMLKFCELIQPYLNSYKQQLSQSCYLVIKDKENNQSKHCLTPEIITLIAKIQKASVMTRVAIDKAVGICRGKISSGLNFQNTSTHSLSPNKINNLATAFADEELMSRTNSEVFWDEITSIEYIGKEEVFDLTIPETHNFIANDFIVHNCMGKKKVSEMEKHREIFIDGATKRGVPSPVAKDLFEQMIKFAEYCFNKSHSTAYAYVAYQTAYLKANYPVEYMAALLTANSGDQDKVQKYIANCQKSNIEVEPPNINQSEVDFTPLPIIATGETKNKILFGLSAVKNVGEGAIEAILNARKKSGEFKSLADLCDRVNLNALNSRTLESLIKCGAFDKIEPNRHQLIKNLEGVIKWAQDRNKDRNMGQLSLFDIPETTMPAFDSSPKYSNVSDFSAKEKLQYEKEILGFYVSDHPLKYAQEQNKILDAISIAQMKEKKSNSKIKLVVMLAGIKPHVTKKGDPMAFLQLEDMTGQVDAVVFSKIYEQIKDLLTENSLLVLNGKVDKKDDESQLLIDSAEGLEKVMADAVEKQEKSGTELYNYQNESRDGEIKINQSATKAETLVEQLESQKNLWKKVAELLITKNGSAKQRQIIILQLSVDLIPEDNSLFEEIQAILKEQSSGDMEKAKVAIGALIFDDKQQILVQFGREFWVEGGEATINRFKAKELEAKLLPTNII